MGVEFSVLMGEVLSRSVLTNLLLSFSFIDEAQSLYEKKMSGKFWGRASYNFHSGLKVPRGLFYILFLSGFFYVTENLRDLVQRTTCVRAEGPALTQQKKALIAECEELENILTVSFFYQLLLLREGCFLLFYNVYICWAKKNFIT